MLFFIAFLNCESHSSSDEINAFENILGERKTEALNLLVFDFESNLKKVYPNLTLQNAYEQYLNDIVSPSTKDFEKFWFQSDETRKKYLSSGLKNEIYLKVKLFNENKQDSVNGIESNNLGKYMQALYKIKDSDSLIAQYHHVKKASGILPNELFVNGFLETNPDFNNYFHKRIAILEFSF